MRKTNRIFLAFVIVLVGAAAHAQPGYWGGMSRGQFQLMPSADADAYYFAVRYRGDSVPEVQIRLSGRALDIRVSQSAGGAGSFYRNSMSRSFRLPRDADPSRMTRREEPGSIVLVIPRWRGPMMPGW